MMRPTSFPSSPPLSPSLSLMAASYSSSPMSFRHFRSSPHPPSRSLSAFSLSLSNRRKRNAIFCFSDPFVLELAEKIEESVPSTDLLSQSLVTLRNSSSRSLLSKNWPSQKEEPFRFTDTKFLRQSLIQPVSPFSLSPSLPFSSSHHLLPIVDGYFSASSVTSLPQSVIVGTLSLIEGVSDVNLQRLLSSFSSDFQDGDLFWSLNGVGTPDAVVIFIPAGCVVEEPLHLGLFSNQGGDEDSGTVAISNPRVMVFVEAGGEVSIIEEFAGGTDSGAYWTNSVMEMMIEEGGKVNHTYIQRQADNSVHTKWTRVLQGASSSYNLVETSTGGKLSRHNLHIEQLGPDTMTELTSFHLAGTNQTQDLHSRLILDHPRGYGRQVHKCIVANSSGHAIFDGNIKVNRLAQKTDAGQLTRSLLLEPRATVNIKPNLQIIADDVKCSHGAAISDLEDEQLFYFRARGVDAQTARNALIYSFAAEVIERLPSSDIRRMAESNVKTLLSSKGATL